MSVLLGQLRSATACAAARAPLGPLSRNLLPRGGAAVLSRYAGGQAAGEDPGTSQGASGPDRGGRRSKRVVKPLSEEGINEQINDNMKKYTEGENAPGRGLGSFKLQWRGSAGHKVPYRFRMQPPPPRQAEDEPKKEKAKDIQSQVYSDYAGLRFPTLETAENYDYYKDRGLGRLVERAFPIKVPGHRRLDPYLREYIHFLHRLDPVRFTVERIAERYRLRKQTVAKVVQEWGTNLYLTRSGLTRLRKKQQTKESAMLAAKEQQYAKWVGWDQLGDQDDPESDDEALGEFKGWRTTGDWIRKQSVEVEMMNAFPMSEKRDPVPKRVDVDMVVDNTENLKVINWIDPTDKVVF